MRKKKEYLGIMPRMTVMEPVVVNADGPSENVASEKIKMISSELSESEQSAVNAMADAQYALEKIRSCLGVSKSMLGNGVVLERIVCGHLSIDYPGRCASHTSEFCKKQCAFNSAWQEVDDDVLPDLGERPLKSFGDFDNREDGK